MDPHKYININIKIYIYMLIVYTHTHIMVLRNQKPTIDMHKVKTKEPIYNAKENHQTTREDTKRREKKELQKQPENQSTR